MSTAQKIVCPVNAVTATRSITSADFGAILTTRGATAAVVLTLPAVQASYKGADVTVFNIADQDLTLAGTAGEVITFNNAAATSVKLGTSSEKIGGGFRAVCDGTSWLIFPLTEETATITVA